MAPIKKGRVTFNTGKKTEEEALKGGDKLERAATNFANGFFGGFMEAPRPAAKGTDYRQLQAGQEQQNVNKNETHTIRELAAETAQSGRQAIQAAAGQGGVPGQEEQGGPYGTVFQPEVEQGSRFTGQENVTDPLTRILNDTQLFENAKKNVLARGLQEGTDEYKTAVKDEYNTTSIKLSNLPDSKDNTLLQALKLHGKGDEVTLEQLTNISNIQNLLQPFGSKTKDVLDALGKGGRFSKTINGVTYEFDLNDTQSLQETIQALQNHEDKDIRDKANRNPQRRNDLVFNEPPKESEPETPAEQLDLEMPEIEGGGRATGQPYRGYGLKDVGLIGGHVTNAELAAQNAGLNIAAYRQEQKAYENALGINLDNQKHELDLRANQLAVSIANLDPEQQKQRRLEFEQSILQDAQFNPQAAKTPIEARAKYAMLDNLFKNVEKEVQRQSFQAQKEQAFADTDSGIQALQARISTGEYKDNPQKAIDDTFAQIEKSSPFLNPLQKAQLIRSSLEGTAGASIQQRLNDIFEQRAGKPIYDTAALTEDFTAYLNTLYGVAEGYGLGEDELTAFGIQATAQAEGAALQIKKYNERILDGKQAEYDFYENQGMTGAAAATAAAYAPVYRRLAASGNLTAEAAYKQRNYFKPIKAEGQGAGSSGFVSTRAKELFPLYERFISSGGSDPGSMDLSVLHDVLYKSAKEHFVKSGDPPDDTYIKDMVNAALVNEIKQRKTGGSNAAQFIYDSLWSSKDSEKLRNQLKTQEGKSITSDQEAAIQHKVDQMERVINRQIMSIYADGGNASNSKEEKEAVEAVRTSAFGDMLFLFDDPPRQDVSLNNKKLQQDFKVFDSLAKSGGDPEALGRDPATSRAYRYNENSLLQKAAATLGLDKANVRLEHLGGNLIVKESKTVNGQEVGLAYLIEDDGKGGLRLRGLIKNLSTVRTQGHGDYIDTGTIIPFKKLKKE
jgi:hypothetical protein